MIILAGSATLGLKGEAEEVAVHLLVLSQHDVSSGSKAGLEEKLGGDDVDHSLSAEELDVDGLRALKTLKSVCQSRQILNRSCGRLSRVEFEELSKVWLGSAAGSCHHLKQVFRDEVQHICACSKETRDAV